MEWIQHSSTCYQVRVGSYSYVPSYQATKVTASRGPRIGNVYPLVWPEARVIPKVKEGGGTVRQVVKPYLPAPIVGWKIEGMDYSQD
jgi:hypothetical protein